MYFVQEYERVTRYIKHEQVSECKNKNIFIECKNKFTTFYVRIISHTNKMKYPFMLRTNHRSLSILNTVHKVLLCYIIHQQLQMKVEWTLFYAACFHYHSIPHCLN